MNRFISRFLTFDKLIGTSLIKGLYFVGLAGIALFTVISFVGAFAAMGQSMAAGLGGLLLAPLIGVLSVAVWRFMCELYLLLFRISDDLREIRNQKISGT